MSRASISKEESYDAWVGSLKNIFQFWGSEEHNVRMTPHCAYVFPDDFCLHEYRCPITHLQEIVLTRVITRNRKSDLKKKEILAQVYSFDILFLHALACLACDFFFKVNTAVFIAMWVKSRISKLILPIFLLQQRSLNCFFLKIVLVSQKVFCVKSIVACG